ncbi:MAG TPA: glycosyltransferase 87 family protein [Blastocatellia bacterium]|nr:glycosyltransferase 87 family protein [Blastocatellia bacterium]
MTGDILWFMTVFLCQFALYMLAGWIAINTPKTDRGVKAITIAVILIFSFAFRERLAVETPYLSSDVYRYIWDGRVQAAGINPYLYMPVAAELEPLRDEKIFPRINRPDYARTIYPPAAQAVFLMTYLISPSDVTAFKVAMSIFDLLAILAIMLALARMRLDPACAIIFAWHPLVIWEGAHSGHIESMLMALLALALLARVAEKHALTGCLLALAVLTKLYPALLLPAFMFANPLPGLLPRLRAVLTDRRNIKMLIAFSITIVIAYLPYIGAGGGVLGYLPGYLKEEGFVETGSRFFLLDLARRFADVPTAAYTVIAAAALIGLAIHVLLKEKRDGVEVARAAAALVGLFLILSTPRYPWYAAWIIPFLCFAPRAGWLYLTGAAVFLYFLWLIPSYPNIPAWIGAAIYAPAVALLALEWLRISKESRGHGATR